MVNTAIVGWTLLWLVVVFIIYKYVINPQIVITPSMKTASKCPDRWTFDNGMCNPDYDTKCVPFDPSKIKLSYQACNIARQCGTNWSEMCL